MITSTRGLVCLLGISLASLVSLVSPTEAAVAGISIDATVSANRNYSSTKVTTPSFSTNAGNELLLAFVSTDAHTDGANVNVARVRGAGLTWVLVVRTNGQLGTAEIWRTFSTGALTNVRVSANLSQSVASSITVVSYAGVNTAGTFGSGAIGAIGTSNAVNGAPAVALTTTANNSWVFAVGNDWDNAINRQPGPDQTLVHEFLPSVGDTYWVQRENTSTPFSGTQVTISDDATNQDRYNLSIVEVLADTGGTLASPPTITTPPSNQTVTTGQTATFTVVAAGTAPLGYQWQKSGTNIAGATSANYTTPVTATTDSGPTFDVVVTNTAGTVTSAAATLTVNAAPVPAIQVSSSAINFGSSVVGSGLTQALLITNTGNATLIITQATLNGSAFSVSGFSPPLNLNAGQQTTITVGFLPTTAGSVSGNILIVSNAPASPTPVTLSGTGIAAILTLDMSPSSLSFGDVTTGTSSPPKIATITNSGNSNVTISQITASGPGYSLTGGSTPVTLAPAQSLTPPTLFNPTAAGSANGTISIVSNATGSPASIALSGSGVAPASHSATLNWTASSSAVSGYNVYRSTVSGSGYTLLNTAFVAGLTYIDSSVQSGTIYFYVATAVDSSSNESVNSNEVTAAVP